MSQPESSRSDVTVGSIVENEKIVTEDEVLGFSMVTGDENPLHLDEEYAEETRFGERIAHGVLGMGILSGAMAEFPGCPILLSWGSMDFIAPMELNERYTGKARIEAEHNERYEVGLELFDEDGFRVMHGEAMILLDSE